MAENDDTDLLAKSTAFHIDTIYTLIGDLTLALEILIRDNFPESPASFAIQGIEETIITMRLHLGSTFSPHQLED